MEPGPLLPVAQGWTHFKHGRLPDCRVLAWRHLLPGRVRRIGVTNHVSRLVTFGQSTVTWDPESPPFERNRESAAQCLRHLVDADVAAAERTARKQEEDVRRSQQARARAAVVAKDPALAPRKRRPLGLPTHRMARMDAPRGMTGTGADAGTGTTPAGVGLSTDLPLLFIQSQTLPIFESRCKRLQLHLSDSISLIRTTGGFRLHGPVQAEAFALNWFRTYVRYRLGSYNATIPILSALLCAK